MNNQDKINKLKNEIHEIEKAELKAEKARQATQARKEKMRIHAANKHKMKRFAENAEAKKMLAYVTEAVRKMTKGYGGEKEQAFMDLYKAQINPPAPKVEKPKAKPKEKGASEG